MRNLHINKDALVNALTELNHVGVLAALLPWKVAVNSKLASPTGRIIFANTHPIEVYSIANKAGEVNYSLDVFLDRDIEESYIWDEEYPESYEEAYNKLSCNLASIVTLGGETFNVVYKEGIINQSISEFIDSDGFPLKYNIIPSELLKPYIDNTGLYNDYE